jgi:hypothetical protein
VGYIKFFNVTKGEESKMTGFMRRMFTTMGFSDESQFEAHAFFPLPFICSKSMLRRWSVATGSRGA